MINSPIHSVVEASERMPEHHTVFSKFKRWEGRYAAGFSVNFLGVITRESFFSTNRVPSEERYEIPSLPAFDEEYFEWIDLLEAVSKATDQFTMIELGAGWGRWLVNAVGAIRNSTETPYRLIGVEPEPTHFQWMKLHFQDNTVDAKSYRLLPAAVSDKDEWVWFYVGRAAEWYGQAIAVPPNFGRFQRLQERLRREGMVGTDRVRKLKAVSLTRLTKPLSRVDLVDLDVQGAELIVLEAAADQLDDKVKRVHIGTHGAEIESGLRTLFQKLGWTKLNDFPCGSESTTRWGIIKFQDGVQSWINPKLS